MPLLAMGPDGQIMFGVDPNNAAEYGGSAVWQNDDGTIWRSPDGGNDGTSNYVRPDLRSAWNQENQSKTADYYNRSGFQQFTPEQVQAFQNSGVKPNADSPNLNPAFGPNLGIYNDSMYGGNNLWYGPQAAPQHTDSRSPFSVESLILPGQEAFGETGQDFWNTNKTGLAVMAMPLVGAGITAALGAGTAGAAGAGVGDAALAGGGEVGSGYAASAVPASEATGGAVGGGATAGSESLIGGAGSDTLGGTAVGEEGFDPSLLEDPSYWNPEGGTTGLADSGASGVAGSSTTYGSTDYVQAAQDLAKQLGITPATALKFLMTAGGAALGGLAGGAKPGGVTTTTQDLPAWLQPYAQGNVAQGQQILNGINPNNPLLPASQNEAMKTIRGDYLDPSSNPYFASSVNDALGLAKSQFAGMYGGAAGQNLDNSGFQEGLARTLGQQATNAYSQNYQSERARQATAAFGAPQLVSQGNAAAFSGNQAFAGLFPNVSSTSVPYFSNPLGNIFSGALGGYALGGGTGK